MSDRSLIVAGCVPLAVSLVLLLVLSRVPPAAGRSTEQHADPAGPESAPSATGPEWSGVVVATNTADLAAAAAGRVSKVYLRTGDTVKKGERLLQFDLEDAENDVAIAHAALRERQSAFASARARVRAAKKRLARFRESAEWISKQELERAEEEVRVAVAEMQAARAQQGSSRATLKGQRRRRERQTLSAPFAGRVIAVDVDPGDSVFAGQTVMRILSHERQVRFAFAPGELPADASPVLLVRLEGKTGEGSLVRTRPGSVRPEVDPSAQLVFATAPLPVSVQDSTAWIPGASVSVRLETP